MGIDSKVEGIAMSDFDAEGRRLHRLMAVSATGPITDPKLSEGRVDFSTRKAQNPPRSEF